MQAAKAVALTFVSPNFFRVVIVPELPNDVGESLLGLFEQRLQMIPPFLCRKVERRRESGRRRRGWWMLLRGSGLRGSYHRGQRFKLKDVTSRAEKCGIRRFALSGDKERL